MTAVTEARTGRIIAWKDGIPLRYEYTAGTAGEAFLRGLWEGRIIASKCATCGEVRLPPRAYCLQCGGRARVDVDLDYYGRVVALSTAHLDRGGRRLASPLRPRFCYVAFEGVTGGLCHRALSAGRKEPRVGDPARPLFRPPDQRKGSILDLEGFLVGTRR